MPDLPSIKPARIADLIPYARNSRTHTDEQVRAVAASIREFGFLNPVITDGKNGIVAGHCRVLAAERLGMEEVPTIEAGHLTPHQVRAYVIADNRLAERGSGWDEELLRIELSELAEAGFDISVTGFDDLDFDLGEDGEAEGDDAAAKPDETYSRKIEAPIYEPSGPCPPVPDLYDEGKTRDLVAEIDAAGLPDDVAAFLRAAAQRHTVFNFRRIADFYAHADAPTQNLMERSALVIIDFDKAIENGFVRMTEKLGAIVAREYPEDG